VSPRATLSAIARDMADAHEQASEAYAFAPSSYTFSAFAAIQAARSAFDAYHAAILEEEDDATLVPPVGHGAGEPV
jgi:hypothetical protein